MLAKIKLFLLGLASIALTVLYIMSRNRKIKAQAEQLKIQKKVIEVNHEVSKARQKAQKQAKKEVDNAIAKAKSGTRDHFASGLRDKDSD